MKLGSPRRRTFSFLSTDALRSRTARVLAWAGMAVLLIFPPVSVAADQRLILKDGTDHLVGSYEVVGERVRYYSAERNAWEEIPASLVDWDATEKAKQEMEQSATTELEEAAEDPPRSIAPGVPLPESEGVYVYDGKSVLPLKQSQAIIENDRKRTILGVLSPLPVVKGRAWIKLAGPSAKMSVAGPSPSFYLQLSDAAAAGYSLVRVQTKDQARVVGEIQITPLTAKMTESRRVVPSTIEQAFPASPDGDPAVLRLTPKEPLPPGEYALIEFVEKEKQNLFVWDFRVASAPATPKP